MLPVKLPEAPEKDPEERKLNDPVVTLTQILNQ